MKDRKCIIITKPSKTWVDKGSEFYKRPMKSWQEKNGVKMVSTNNKWKSGAAERFIKTLKKTIYKYMTSGSKNLHTGKLDNYS